MSSAQIVPATASEARDLTDQIKIAVDGTWHLIKRAYLTRAWAALGYDSWDDYCTREFGTSRIRIPREERQGVVASMRESGMSTRAIAAATGTHHSTVADDLRGVGNPTPPRLEAVRDYYDTRDTADEMDDGHWEEDEPVASVQREVDQRVIGTDGKSYTASPTRTQSRPALPPRFLSAVNDLGKIVARVEKLRSDDRFRLNRGVIADQCVPPIRRAIEVLSDLMDDLGQDDGGPT